MFLAAPVRAQSAFVPYVGYNIEDEDFILGLAFRLGLPIQSQVGLSLQPGVEYQFAGIDDLTVAQFNADVLAHFRSSPSITPYAGAGIGILYLSAGDESETEFGLNLLGGVEFSDTAAGRPFVQGRFSTRGDADDAFTLMGGTVFNF